LITIFRVFCLISLTDDVYVGALDLKGPLRAQGGSSGQKNGFQTTGYSPGRLSITLVFYLIFEIDGPAYVKGAPLKLPTAAGIARVL